MTIMVCCYYHILDITWSYMSRIKDIAFLLWCSYLKMKNIRKYLFFIATVFVTLGSFGFTQDYATVTDWDFNSSNTTVNLYSWWVSTVQAIWINTIWTWENKNWTLIDVIKNFINRVLGILSLIALVLCLWWWFQIVTAAWDEWKQKKWMSVLFVVTIIFWILRGVTWWQGWNGWNWGI